ncbi:acetyltransferase [Gramella lutea]|uniref:Acetyltransferase n=1 Tax=Christiangramia lutea TaxID=1607951 RepID=A0A9X1V457_9FLAO|nr:acetyltransferase [Christiangramia lutea]MCH4823818.1 acetyltransferase [Christiangramia lutea]
MIIFGASGHGKVIIDVIESTGNSVDFVIDDDVSVKELLEYKVDHSFNASMKNQPVIIAVGKNQTRKRIAERLENSISEALVHRSAMVSNSSFIDFGSVVMANASINSSATIGKHCIINTNSVVEHDSILSDFVHISPGAVITGNVKIGEGSHVGAGAIVIPGITIGKWVTIGAGAVIIEDIPDNAVVVGNPGRIIKFNTVENE